MPHRAKPRAAAIAVGLAGLLTLLCVAHMARRVQVGLSANRWPLPPTISYLEWIEQRVRGDEELGVLRIGSPPTDQEVHTEARIQHAIVPTVLVGEERDRVAVIFEHDVDRDELRRQLEERGYPHVLLRPHSNVGLAGRRALPPSQPPRPHPARDGRLAGLLLLAAVTVLPAGLAAALGGARPFFLTLLAAPPALGLGAAVGAAVTGAAETGGTGTASLAATLVVSLLLLGAWIVLVLPLRAAPLEQGAPCPWRGRLLALTAGVLVLGATGAVLGFGACLEGGVDAIRMFNLRARFMLRADAFLAPFTDAGYLHSTHPDYPPLMAYAVSGAYRLAGGATTLAPIWLHATIWIGGVGFLVHWAWRACGPLAGLVAAAMLGAHPFWVQEITQQLCDAPLGLALASALLAWRLSIDDAAGGRRQALVAGCLAGIALLTKNEGALLVLLLCGSITLWTLRQPRKRLGQAGAVALGLAPWVLLLLVFKAFAPQNDLVQGSRLESASWERAGLILADYWRIVSHPLLFKGVFLIVAGGAVARALGLLPRGQASGWQTAVASVLFLAALGYFCVYLVTPHDLHWHLSTSSKRLFTQLLPATVLLGATYVRDALAD